MARPPTTTTSRPRTIAQSFGKSGSSPHGLQNSLPKDSFGAASMPYSQPCPTPFGSTDDFASYLLPELQPHLMPPPPITPRPSHSSPSGQQASSSVSPQQLDSHFSYTHHYPSSDFFANPPLPAGYVYDPSAMFLPAEEYVALPTHAPPQVPPAPERPATEVSSESEVGPSSTVKPHTPRPPNAWILYRSDMLRAIGAGDEVPGLNSIMAELGVSGTSESSSEEKVTEATDGAAKAKAKSRKKPKKNAKEPTEGLLSLGPGKTGRGLPQADISKMISMLWKREKPEIRAEYEARSEQKKQEHTLLYPGYKFQPLRKADKIRQREEKEREKEAARREKDLQKSGGSGSRRRPRTRTRLSPTAPYSVSSPTGDRSLARSLTYSGHNSSTESPHDHLRGHASRLGTPLDTPDEQRFRSYPFPMPQSSLPSMRPDEVGNAFESIPSQHHSMAHSTSTPNLGQTSALPSSVAMSHAMSGPYDSPQALPHRDRSMAPPPIPKRIISYADDGPSSGPSADDIVSMWSTMPEDAGSPPEPPLQPFKQDDLQHSFRPHPHGDSNLPYSASEYNTFNEIELRNLAPPPQPSGWVNVDHYDGNGWAPPPRDSRAFDEGRHMAYVPMVEGDGSVSMPVMYASDPSAAQYADHLWQTQYTIEGDDDDSPIILTSDPSDPRTVTMEAVVFEDDPSSSSSGPFLSESAVFSPSDIEWALSAAEPNATNDASPSDDTDGSASLFAYHTVPRHISASAFPITPRSSSQSLESMPWMDRNTSYAFASAFSGQLDAGVGDDMIDWMADDDASDMAPGTLPRNLSRSSAESGYVERRSISSASGFPDAKRKRPTKLAEATTSVEAVAE